MDDVIFEEFKGTGNSEITSIDDLATRDFSQLSICSVQERARKNC